jgi:hypothetical protein
MRSYIQFQKNQAQVRARRKTEHLKDIRQDGSGNWAYEGEWMECTLEEGVRRRVTAALWLLLSGAAACCLICGCIRGTGMEGCWYVLIPYASAVFAVCFCIRHLWAVTAGRGRMWKHHHAKHMLALAPCLVWGFVSCLLCVTGRTGLALFSGGWNSASGPGTASGSILFLVLQAASAAAFLAAWHLQKKLVWKTAPKTETENRHN